MSNTPSKLSIIFAGEDLVAKFLDGTTSPVRVRAMPARHLGRVLNFADKEAELLDFICLVPLAEGEKIEGEEIAGWKRVPPLWADNLDPESHAQLYEAAKRLNFSQAAKWAERQIAAKTYTGELALKAEEALMPMMRQIVDLLGSLPQPQPKPAAPLRPS